ncbi:MAG TPA: MFS transporter [Prolixibacteraceae bacterium]|nr:MFS transporter [Prolixibacteraceae bacterium]
MNWTKKQISILAIVAASSFFGTFLISSVNIALPAIEKDFGLDAVTLSWVVTAFLLSTAMFLLPVGRWGDLTGIRRLYKTGMVIFTVSSLLSGFATSGYWLIVLRFLQGIGAAFTSTTGAAILVSAFLPQYRGRVLGISVSGVYLGLAFGPFFGGFLTQYLGWRSIFFMSSGFGLLITIIAFLFLGKDEEQKKERIKLDFKGTVFYMLGLVGLAYGSARIPQLFGWSLMGAGAIFLMIFWMLENRSANPVLETRLFTHNRLFAFSNLAALINYSATFSIIFLLSLYLQKVKGLSPRDAGSILVAQPIVMALFSPVTGRLSDRIQPRYLATAGMTMCTIGLAAFAFLTESTPIALIVILLFWVGTGFALFSSPNMNTIMSSVQKNQLGLASGSASTMRVVGQITSMTIATLFFAILFNKQAVETVSNPLFLKALKFGFITFATISVAGIYFSFNRGKMSREQQ